MNALISKIRHTINEFSVVEKVIFFILSFFLIWSVFMLLYSALDIFRKDAPMRGGELHEGVVGYPSYINPLLSTTNSGRDLSYLLYSGLMRINEKGVLVPDLAENYTISSDGTEYTFILRKDAKFHDDTPLTSADVLFTIEKAKDPSIKSSLAPNWQGVTVKATDERTVVFTLRTPYAPFIENATLGILPKHIWNDTDLDQFTFSPYNFSPIGSGPYKVKKITRSASGNPSLYELSAWKGYAPGERNISRIFIHLYPDNQSLLNALKEGKIESAGNLSPVEAESLKKEGIDIRTASLLRIFGVFFNQNQATLFIDKNVRLALEQAVDRNRIIDTVLLSYANREDGPLPDGAEGEFDASEAISTLTRAGWTKNADGIMEKKDAKGTQTLTFTLTTSDSEELVATANLLKEQWAAIGANVTIDVKSPSELAETVIRPRKYDALLFGEVTGRGRDLYPFWHSGERRDPGLNIALYTNGKADNALEAARTATSTAKTDASLEAFQNFFREDVPAVILYSPRFIYAVPEKIKGLELPPLEMAHERFAGILSSYINTKRVWK